MSPQRWVRISISWTAALSILIAAPILADDAPTVSFRRDDAHGRLKVLVNGAEFAEYVYRDDKVLRPYLRNVRPPGGPQVTRNHPPIPGQDPTDHDRMHPGIWLGFGDFGGQDYWRNKAKVRHDRFTLEPQAQMDGDAGGFAVMNSYLTADGSKTIAIERCRLDFSAKPSGVLIVWESQFTAANANAGASAPCAFGDQEEMGLGVRVATPIAVKSGAGQIRNSEGKLNESGVWGRQADWCDYGAAIEGQRVGLLLMPDPKNFRRSWLHARDYGVLVANPFGQAAFARGEPSRIEVKENQPLTLRFGILAYARPSAEPIDAAAAYREFLKTNADKVKR